jgi:uncharacterized membrane protein YuzA (DUF378 family)
MDADASALATNTLCIEARLLTDSYIPPIIPWCEAGISTPASHQSNLQPENRSEPGLFVALYRVLDFVTGLFHLVSNMFHRLVYFLAGLLGRTFGLLATGQSSKRHEKRTDNQG